jgi:hypothetical protein
MKLRFYGAIPVLMATLALPAVAQFEVSPDHFDDNPAENPRISNSHSHAVIEQQLATHQARLTGYHKQIKAQVALVEEARQKLNSLAENTERAGANIAFQARQRDLQALRRSLAGPIRYAKATIAALKTERKFLATAELRPIIPRFVRGSS